MKFLGLCCLLILALLGCLPAPGNATPSRHTGPGSGSGYGPGSNPFRNPNPQPRPFIYDSPIPRPGPKTMYA
ncbi:hypothetical protein KR059_002507 [Drosophila kikkawai]|nr:immune-induced peptide 18 [Drosophila kikkawai]KAH8308850.1 hypothetical protein KR059_002507 [Drosophila kikkawai]